MRLNARARHAVRLVVELHRLGRDGQPVQLSQVSMSTNISRRFLEQIAMALKSHGILRGVCGRGGGYRLARPPAEITIGQILRAVLGPIEIATCTREPADCMSAEFCECRLLWLLLQRRIDSVLDEYSVADMLDRNAQTKLKRLLERERGGRRVVLRAAQGGA